MYLRHIIHRYCYENTFSFNIRITSYKKLTTCTTDMKNIISVNFIKYYNNSLFIYLPSIFSAGLGHVNIIYNIQTRDFIGPKITEFIANYISTTIFCKPK